MPGGFHPFHAGHASLYQSALKAFPDADVYVAATNDQKTRPFPFSIKEKLAKVAGVAPGHFVQVKSPFKAEEITQNYDPNEDVLIFVRSEKDRTEQPKPGGTKKDGTPAYFQPYTGKNMQPFSKHAYIAYLPTIEFGPGIKSASEIRELWPKLNDKRKLAMVMSLYPATQKNAKLANNVKQMLDIGMGGEELNEFAPSKPPTATPTGGGGGKKDYGQPTSSRYIGGDKFVLGTSNNYILTATIDKWGLEWDEDDEIWFLDSPGAAHIADATEGEIELPPPQEQRYQIHDLVTDYLNDHNSADLQKVAKYFGHSDDGEMATNENAKVQPVAKSVPIQNTKTQPKQNVYVAPEKKTPAVVNHIKRKAEDELDEYNIPQTKKFIQQAHDKEHNQMYGSKPYSTHPRAVAAIGRKLFGSKFGPDAVKVALLHDVLEDTKYTPENLAEKGFSKEIIDAVKLLTKNKQLSYNDNIQAIINSGNKLAMMVKYCDNLANFSGDKSHFDPAKAQRLQQRYLASLDMLGDALGVRQHLSNPEPKQVTESEDYLEEK